MRLTVHAWLYACGVLAYYYALFCGVTGYQAR